MWEKTFGILGTLEDACTKRAKPEDLVLAKGHRILMRQGNACQHWNCKLRYTSKLLAALPPSGSANIVPEKGAWWLLAGCYVAFFGS